MVGLNNVSSSIDDVLVPDVSGRVLGKVFDYTLYHGARLRTIIVATYGNASSAFNEKNIATTVKAVSDIQLAVDVAA
ncbi:hypothetical protein L7F22_014205 [Adiantum nelumboides]|nr:hypothetical protein [Adiantum nelumboides]